MNSILEDIKQASEATKSARKEMKEKLDAIVEIVLDMSQRCIETVIEHRNHESVSLDPILFTTKRTVEFVAEGLASSYYVGYIVEQLQKRLKEKGLYKEVSLK